MSWFAIISLVLQLVSTLVRMGQEKKWITEGEDREIAKNLAKTLELTRAGKIIMENLAQLSDDELDDLLRDLEGKPGAGDK
jgi:hypothetical protein